MIKEAKQSQHTRIMSNHYKYKLLSYEHTHTHLKIMKTLMWFKHA